MAKDQEQVVVQSVEQLESFVPQDMVDVLCQAYAAEDATYEALLKVAVGKPIAELIRYMAGYRRRWMALEVGDEVQASMMAAAEEVLKSHGLIEVDRHEELQVMQKAIMVEVENLMFRLVPEQTEQFKQDEPEAKPEE